MGSLEVALLKEAEEAEPGYGSAPIVPFSSEGRDVFVMSDLHVGEGLARDGTYASREKFFADDAFGRLLEHLSTLSGPGTLLVLNGDVIDFLRLTRLPSSEGDFGRWNALLERMGMPPQPQDCISGTERRYGFVTTDAKSVWKLMEIVAGHRDFFAALTAWLESGRRLVIVKGNHDLEWFWPAVRNALRLLLADSATSEDTLRRFVLPGLRFVDDAMLIDGTFYVRHGHQFDPLCRVDGPPTLTGGTELNLPAGSFFNRYILNKVELAYPYADNIRPRENVLPMLVREHLPSALKLLLVHVPAFVKWVPKGKLLRIYSRAIWVTIAFLAPIVIVAIAYRDRLAALFDALVGSSAAPTSPGTWFLASVEGLLRTAATLVLSYASGRLAARLQIEQPDSLDADARETFERNPSWELATFGHTHNPEQRLHGKRWFFNTGTWIPIVETDSAELRLDKTYTYLHLQFAGGSLSPGGLRRWNDDAQRSEPALIVRHLTD